MDFRFLVLGIDIYRRSGVGQCSEPVLRKHVRDRKLHEQDRLSDAALAAEQPYIPQRKAVLNRPVARWRRLLGPLADIAKHQRAVVRRRCSRTLGVKLDKIEDTHVAHNPSLSASRTSIRSDPISGITTRTRRPALRQ